MTVVSKSEVKFLAAVDSECCVTIYMPLHTTYPETKADPITFRNLLDTCREELTQKIGQEQAQAFTKPLQMLLQNEAFWHSSADQGLCVMCAEGEVRIYRLPYAVPESYEISSHFYLTPLLHALQQNGEFYVLSLSPDCVQLFRGNNTELIPVELPDDVPQSLEAQEVSVHTEFQPSKHLHTTTYLRSSERSIGATHGHVDQRNDRHELFVQFMHRIAHHLEPFLAEDPLPLYLAAAEKNQAAFRKILRFPILEPDGIVESPDGLNHTDILSRALPLFRNRLQAERDSLRKFYEENRHSLMTSDDASLIAEAAGQGRVEVLFTKMNERRWGQRDQSTGRYIEQWEKRQDSIDLINEAVRQTLLHGGKVLVDSGDELEGDDVTANLRW